MTKFVVSALFVASLSACTGISTDDLFGLPQNEDRVDTQATEGLETLSPNESTRAPVEGVGPEREPSREPATLLNCAITETCE